MIFFWGVSLGDPLCCRRYLVVTVGRGVPYHGLSRITMLISAMVADFVVVVSVIPVVLLQLP